MELIRDQKKTTVNRVYLRVPTKPEAGVIATSPEIAPEQKPTALHLRSMR